MDLEYLKNTKIIAALCATILMMGCTNGTDTAKTKPQWIQETTNNQISSCVQAQDTDEKTLQKIALAKAKATYSMNKRVSVTTTTEKENSDFQKKSIQSSQNSFGSSDMNIIDTYKSDSLYCLLLEFKELD